MKTYCEERVVDMFGREYTTTNASWWVWMFGCLPAENCEFCSEHDSREPSTGNKE